MKFAQSVKAAHCILQHMMALAMIGAETDALRRTMCGPSVFTDLDLYGLLALASPRTRLGSAGQEPSA
jgi:hypothetical protein